MTPGRAAPSTLALTVPVDPAASGLREKAAGSALADAAGGACRPLDAGA